ncbi:CAP domain-containing protein [Paucibacter soli]|uniref:CAP domain-containing protein n=1 Tax=Paucibacter soli TaxID=3133433 RepID=UPI0030B61876
MTKTLRFAFVVTLTAALAACGGGGGSSTAPSTPTTPTTPTTPVPVVSDAGNLKTSAAAPTYAAGTLAESAYTALNTVRLAAGAGLLSQDAQIDVAAAAHAKYLTTNLSTVTSYHNEDSSKFDFYAVTPGDRIAKAGYSAAFSTEAVGGTGASQLGADCVLGLLNTVYHGAALLSRNSAVGFGFGLDGAQIPLCVADLASPVADKIGQVPAVASLVAYPYAGQKSVMETFYVGAESPRPSAVLFPNATAGTPVLVSVRNADYLNFQDAGTLNATVTEFSLKDAGGNAVAAAVVANSALKGQGVTLNADANLAEGFAVLVPLAPLVKGQTYTATFTATLKAGGAALTKTWSFSTNQ